MNASYLGNHKTLANLRRPHYLRNLCPIRCITVHDDYYYLKDNKCATRSASIIDTRPSGGHKLFGGELLGVSWQRVRTKWSVQGRYGARVSGAMPVTALYGTPVRPALTRLNHRSRLILIDCRGYHFRHTGPCITYVDKRNGAHKWANLQ
jgi:hypothetical protein